MFKLDLPLRLMKRHHILIALFAMLILSACSSRRGGKGCDCPTFGQVNQPKATLQQVQA
jgi:outer membrane biogenesis lipoprotein LolB